ncbi:Pr6Pr family membrane protein [Sediminibacterium goheungense]|uniref:FAR-17a/AIG1-like protein n=1 Tax=Sediminibacterium goheungense TaxID=1086393 RepID=A0A4R6IWP9_9BACT|nr:Pr6Pr family membrane protein [Sediminibacterium goheungense]TDO27152.1 hypothetical protein BC659_2471 [Sediminibacterium goheungense]
MHNLPTAKTKWLSFAGFLFAWSGIIIQLFDFLRTTDLSIADTLIKFFSYFTILTNIMVAIYYTAVLLAPSSSPGKFCIRFSTSTAIAVYILVVGIIYNITLRSIWTFTGWSRISNELLHTVTPIYFIIYWIVATFKTKLFFRSMLYWGIYPLAYFVYTILRGSIVHSYPYPFINADTLGYQQVLINCLMVAAVFYGLFALFIWIGNRLKSH